MMASKRFWRPATSAMGRHCSKSVMSPSLGMQLIAKVPCRGLGEVRIGRILQINMFLESRSNDDKVSKAQHEKQLIGNSVICRGFVSKDACTGAENHVNRNSKAWPALSSCFGLPMAEPCKNSMWWVGVILEETLEILSHNIRPGFLGSGG
eukprot:11194150-Lingulodinium_polyedra.AAC.1